MKLSNLSGRFVFFTSLIFLCIGLSGQTQQQQPKTVTLVLSIEHAETVMTALSKMPYETAAPIIQTIQQQAMAQLNPPQKGDSSKPKKN